MVEILALAGGAAAGISDVDRHPPRQLLQWQTSPRVAGLQKELPVQCYLVPAPRPEAAP